MEDASIDANCQRGERHSSATRLSVDFLLGLLGQGWSEAEVLRNYPGLTHEDVLACLEYASYDKLTASG